MRARLGYSVLAVASAAGIVYLVHIVASFLRAAETLVKIGIQSWQ